MTAIPINNVKYEIVSSANEDMTGLYEVIWALNTQYPTITKADKINYSKLAITELIQKNIIDLYKKNWDTGVEQKIEKETALEIVIHNNSWDAPSDDTDSEYYCFCAADEKAL